MRVVHNPLFSHHQIELEHPWKERVDLQKENRATLQDVVAPLEGRANLQEDHHIVREETAFHGILLQETDVLKKGVIIDDVEAVKMKSETTGREAEVIPLDVVAVQVAVHLGGGVLEVEVGIGVKVL